MSAGTDSHLWKGAHDPPPPAAAHTGCPELLAMCLGTLRLGRGKPLSRPLADKRPSWEQDAMIPALNYRGSRQIRVLQMFGHRVFGGGGVM